MLISEYAVNRMGDAVADLAAAAGLPNLKANPVVPSDQAAALKATWPMLPCYPASGRTKLAAGWLIEQCGWKGRRLGAAGVHAEHALVLVNHGGASGGDLLALAEAIRTDVQARFGVELEMEPRVLR